MAKLSDFTKQQILECYVEMYDFVMSFEPVSEDIDDIDLFDTDDEEDDDEDSSFDYDYMIHEIEKKEICIPEETYNKIIGFAKDKLSQMTFREVFRDSNADREYFLEARKQFENALKEFGKTELYPLLV